MSVTNGWLSWTKHVPNPCTGKVYAGVNSGRFGIACHSMEGLLWGKDYIPRAFQCSGPNTDLSNMFTLRLDGVLCQHFPVTAKCWCSGDADANSTTWSVEAEGFQGEPLTAAQSDAMLRLFAEWESYTGRVATRGEGTLVAFPWGGGRSYPVDRTLWQHKEIIATACPSGRYDETFAAWAAQEEGMASAEYEELKARLDQVVIGGWTTQQRLDALTDPSGGFASLDGRLTNQESNDGPVGELYKRLGDHTANHPGASVVTDHRHDMQIAVSETGPVKRNGG